MSLILKDKIDVLMRGYPTVSDKYNVRGATLASDSAVGYFGDIVKIKGNGYFTVASAANTIADANEVAGVLMATNVKLVQPYGAGSSAKAPTMPGEAFNLMVSGYVALPVEVKGAAETPTAAEIKTALEGIHEGDDAKVTASGKVAKDGTIEMGWKFTGVTFVDETGEGLAEVLILPKNC